LLKISFTYRKISGDHVMRIAFFDSGIGGITVLKGAISLMPEHDYVYYADTKNIPYGTKSKDEVKRYIFDAVDFLAKKDIHSLVIACNTATSVAVNDLRMKYAFPIIGMEPAVKPAIMHNTGKKILVLATSLTLKESKLETLIKKLDRNQLVEKMEMDRLVQYAERFDFSSSDVMEYIENKLSRIFLNEYETIVLGCTHFVYYRRLIEDIAHHEISVIDGNDGTVRNLANTLRNLEQAGKTGDGRISFYSSGVEDDAERSRKLMELMSLR
jgi:glutamate racemase